MPESLCKARTAMLMWLSSRPSHLKRNAVKTAFKPLQKHNKQSAYLSINMTEITASNINSYGLWQPLYDHQVLINSILGITDQITDQKVPIWYELNSYGCNDNRELDQMLFRTREHNTYTVLP